MTYFWACTLLKYDFLVKLKVSFFKIIKHCPKHNFGIVVHVQAPLIDDGMPIYLFRRSGGLTNQKTLTF